ncbi:MAG: hypothetical protein IK051_11315 [Rhodocyclaceae bacterium]|nr:hypothetical protein [Rhodocyclaceae bacterium]
MTPQIEAWVVGASIAGVASMSAAAVLEAGRRCRQRTTPPHASARWFFTLRV